MSEPLSQDVVAAVCRHMNDDHRADALLICRELAGCRDAVDAETVGVDGAALHLRVRQVDGTVTAVSVPFAVPVHERADVRRAVVELHERARLAAGPAPHSR